jgi:hypothetical protein
MPAKNPGGRSSTLPNWSGHPVALAYRVDTLENAASAEQNFVTSYHETDTINTNSEYRIMILTL